MRLWNSREMLFLFPGSVVTRFLEMKLHHWRVAEQGPWMQSPAGSCRGKLVATSQ